MGKLSRMALKTVTGALAFWLFWMAGSAYSTRMSEVARTVPSRTEPAPVQQADAAD